MEKFIKSGNLNLLWEGIGEEQFIQTKRNMKH